MIYLDGTALVKIAVAAPETGALLAFLEPHTERVTSALARTEVLRAIRRSGAAARTEERARAMFDRLALIKVDAMVLAAAADLEPLDLHLLDAIHLATAASLPGLAAFVTYDARLARLARRQSLTVEAPGS